MFFQVKEKSWSVRLVEGYILNDQVRADRCANCRSITEVLVANHNNPNLLLYGCKDSKCKHRLLRLDLNNEILRKTLLQEKASAAPKEIKEICTEAIAPTISA